MTPPALPTPEIWPSGTAIRLPLGVHTWTGRRGTLIRPGLPDADIDTAEGLEIGLATLISLAPSPLPPPLVREVAPIAPVAPVARPTVATSGRTSAREVIASFNAEHPVDALLGRYGATRTREGYACTCGVAHEHETQLIVTAQGRIVFFSPRCRWAPSRTDRNGRPIADAFDLYTQVEHRGDKTAALKAYNPIAPRPAEPEHQEAERAAPDAATLEARARDAARKREARRAEAAANREGARTRAAESTALGASPTAAGVLRLMFDIAGDRDWCRPSKAALAEQLGCSERTVQRALVWLEGRFITTEEHVNGAGIAWRGGRSGTPRRTFLREPLCSIGTPQTGEAGETRSDGEKGDMSPEYKYTEILEHVSDRVSAPPSPPAPGAPDGLDTWEWVDAAHGADELDDQVDSEPAASFSPPAAPPAPRRLRDMQGLDWHVAQLRALDEYRAQQAPPLAPIALPEPEAEDAPEVRGPPRDPERARQYWALLGKANKPTTGAAQRRALRLKAAELEEWYSALEAPALRPPPVASSHRPRVLALPLGEATGAPSPAPCPEPTPPPPPARGPWLPDDYDRDGLVDRLRRLREPATYAAAAD